jgi:aspartyl protease family protein
VPALVARPGMLGENLLGMTFLERLASYEVRGNRLVLRAVRS